MRGYWFEIDAPDGRRLLANVLYPEATPPFPVVVSLHSSGGFSTGAITGLGYDLAVAGFMVVSGCWFAGAAPGSPPATPLVDCPNAPPYDYTSLHSVTYARALVEAAPTLLGADPSRVGVTGQSRGATEALLLASTGVNVRAVVSDSAGFVGGYGLSPRDTPPIDIAKDLSAPVLILHGTADATVPLATAHQYEDRLRALGKVVEARYYEGAEHVLQRKDSPFYRDALQRTIDFFKKYLGA